MAIIVEEEKKGADYLRIFGWVAVIGVVGAAAYYLFFTAPELVIIQPPADFQVITPISQISLHPEDILNSPGYQSLKAPTFSLPTQQGPGAVGRSDPFITP